MADEKVEVKEIVTREEIPEYFLKFLHEYAAKGGENYGLVPVRISIEHISPEVCADRSSQVSEIRVLYKTKNWVKQRSGE